MKLYKCPVCGNIIWIMEGNSSPIRCCGEELEEIVCNTVDAALEKHVPTYSVKDNKIEVAIGEVMHPMDEAHYITWIAMVDGNNIVMNKLTPNDKPILEYDYIKGSKIYSYCNLHGLWMTEVK